MADPRHRESGTPSDDRTPSGRRIPIAAFGVSVALGMAMLTFWLLAEPVPGVFLPFAAALLLVLLGLVGMVCVALRE